MNEDQVRKARQQLLRELPDPTEILRGRYWIAGSSIARVARSAVGEKATGWVLTWAIPEDEHASSLCQPKQSLQVQRWLRNYRKLRAKLEAICELNHELLGADP